MPGSLWAQVLVSDKIHLLGWALRGHTKGKKERFPGIGHNCRAHLGGKACL